MEPRCSSSCSPRSCRRSRCARSRSVACESELVARCRTMVSERQAPPGRRVRHAARLAVSITDVHGKSPDRQVSSSGPSIKAPPSRPSPGSREKDGVSVEALERIDTPKGEVRRARQRRAAAASRRESRASGRRGAEAAAGGEGSCAGARRGAVRAAGARTGHAARQACRARNGARPGAGEPHARPPLHGQRHDRARRCRRVRRRCARKAW